MTEFLNKSNAEYHDSIYFILKEKIDYIKKYLSSSTLYSISTGDRSRRLVEYLCELETFNENNKEILSYISYYNPTSEAPLSHYLDTIFESLDNITTDNYNPDSSTELKNIRGILKTVLAECRKIPLLNKLMGNKQNTIIVGANGSGKSSLANYIKNSVAPNIKVLPATKFLYQHSEGSSLESFRSTPVDINELMSSSNIKPEQYYFPNDMHLSFTKLIHALVNNHSQHCVDVAAGRFTKESESYFAKLQYIWSDLIPNVLLHINTKNITIHGISNEYEYPLNQTSDGERAIIYYAGSVLMAEQNSFIIVDEPETFLNDNISLKLWNRLCSVRKDCKFIFISHNLNFIEGIGNSELVWCKSFIYPEKWELQELIPSDLPTELVVQIASSQKNILYCEGELDKKVYELLFGEQYTIINVNGHQNVVNYTQLHKKHNLLKDIHCAGIIDRDHLTEDQIHKYLENSIHVLEQNEIEMFLVCDEVISETLDRIYKSGYQEKIECFKTAFFEKLEHRKEKIILRKIKSELDYFLSNIKIENDKSISELSSSLINILSKLILKDKSSSTIDINSRLSLSENKIEKFIENKFDYYKSNFDSLLHEKNYSAALSICNLKEEVSKGLANQYLISNYIEMALISLTDDNFNKKLIKKYFPSI